MLFDYFFDNIVTLFLILLFGIRLLNKKAFKNTETRYFWLTLVSCLILVVEDAAENYSANFPSLYYLRITLSIIGYTLRSTAALGLLLVIIPRKYRHFLWWVPCIIVLLINSTAYFSKIAFYFNEEYAFRRGPLGIVSFIVPIFYILAIVAFSFRSLFEKGRGAQRFIIPACILFCIVATIKGVLFGGSDLNVAIMTSSIFFYIVLYSQDNRLDALTGLLNRQAFYDDSTTLSKSIKAIASLDMNGLKEINDNYGHQFGDDALKKIGECLYNTKNRNMSAYRIGGDEFTILFFYDNKDEIEEFIKLIKEKVASCGYSISAGYAICDGTHSLEETIGEADRMMYDDKARYYQESGLNRRKNRAPKIDD